MDNTFTQDHFNAIIWYAIAEFVVGMLLEAAKQGQLDSEKELDTAVLMQDVIDALKSHPSISPETRLKGNANVDQSQRKTVTANKYYLSIMEDLFRAQNKLRQYLNNYAGDQIRPVIIRKIADIVKGIPKIIRNPETNSLTINHTAVDQFTNELSDSLNQLFDTAYVYEEPPTNHFIISFLSHPIMRGLSSLSLLGGAFTLTAGVLAAIGLVTGLPVATVVGLIAGGAVASIAGISLLTSSFFRHSSPEELAAKHEKIAIPLMTATEEENELQPSEANNSSEEESEPQDLDLEIVPALSID